MYEYHCQLLRIIDGDTVEIDIELGFDITLRRQKVRLYGLDTAESRTKDNFEDSVGEFTTAALRGWVKGHKAAILLSQEFDRGKYGRVLGDILFYDHEGASRKWSDLMQESGLVVPQGWPKDRKQRYWLRMYQNLRDMGAITLDKKGRVYDPNEFIWPTSEDIKERVDQSALEE